MPNCDYLDIGPAPVEENCAQVGSENYQEKARKECRAFINQLRRQFGIEPDGPTTLYLKSNSHDFGVYYSVVVKYDTDDEKSTEYAFKLESETPEKWDSDARKELGLNNPDIIHLYKVKIEDVKPDKEYLCIKGDKKYLSVVRSWHEIGTLYIDAPQERRVYDLQDLDAIYEFVL